jgi:MFS family permease
LTPFLEHECQLSPYSIALLLAIQQLLGIPANTWAGRTADRLELRFPGTGRAGTVAVGTTLGTLCFVWHGASRLVVDSSQRDNWSSDFVWFLCLRILYSVSVSLVSPVLDGLCLQFLNDRRQDYGKERLWGAITWAVTNVLLGPALDRVGFVILYPLGVISCLAVLCSLYVYTATTAGTRLSSRYQPVAPKICHGLVQLTTLPRSCSEDTISDGDLDGALDLCRPERLNLHGDKPDSNDDNDLVCDDDDENDHSSVSATATTVDTTISTMDLVRRLLFGASPWYYGCCFMIAFVMLSSGQVIVDSLIFLFFEDLGSSYTVMGWTVVLTVLFEIPVFSVADQLLERYGSTVLLLTAMACYVVRVLGYTLLPSGHVVYALVVEPMHGITYACSQTAVVDFVAQNMPVGYEATGQGLVYVVRGLGNVSGLLVGGWAQETLGPRILYRGAAVVVSCGSAILALASYFRQRYHARQPVSTRDDKNDSVTIDCEAESS